MSAAPNPPPRRVLLSAEAADLWRFGRVSLALAALGAFGWFVISDAGSVLFTLLLAWFASVALEPAVRRLARHMPRARAVVVVMASVGLFLMLFLAAFGRLFAQQVAQLLRLLPGVIEAGLDRVNQRFSTSYSTADVLSSVHLTPQEAARYADEVLGGALQLLGSVAGAFISLFAFVLLTYYLSADGPRLRLWIAGLLPGRAQELFVAVWDLTTVKTGGYVAARVVLAAINGGTSALVFALIGLPSWLALGLWTGLVAQFIPTIGTYISILLPVLVGLLSADPWTGVIAFAWAVVYQQIENLTLEPRISARAVEVHPAVAFASVLLGSALFGAAGALLAVPVCAVLLALLGTYVERHDLLTAPAAAPLPTSEPPTDPAAQPGAAGAETASE